MTSIPEVSAVNTVTATTATRRLCILLFRQGTCTPQIPEVQWLRLHFWNWSGHFWSDRKAWYCEAVKSCLKPMWDAQPETANHAAEEAEERIVWFRSRISRSDVIWCYLMLSDVVIMFMLNDDFRSQGLVVPWGLKTAVLFRRAAMCIQRCWRAPGFEKPRT